MKKDILCFYIFLAILAPHRSPKDSFDLSNLKSKNPIEHFKYWFDYIHTNKLCKEANAVCLATSTKYTSKINWFDLWHFIFFSILRDGRPSNRIVLVKDFSDKGFKFFTNYTSKKGQELEANPYASMCFYWDAVSRQVRIDGKVHKISSQESEEYFSKRPLNSRISAYISDQSKVIKDRNVGLNKLFLWLLRHVYFTS